MVPRMPLLLRLKEQHPKLSTQVSLHPVLVQVAHCNPVRSLRLYTSHVSKYDPYNVSFFRLVCCLRTRWSCCERPKRKTSGRNSRCVSLESRFNHSKTSKLSRSTPQRRMHRPSLLRPKSHDISSSRHHHSLYAVLSQSPSSPLSRVSIACMQTLNYSSALDVYAHSKRSSLSLC